MADGTAAGNIQTVGVPVVVVFRKRSDMPGDLLSEAERRRVRDYCLEYGAAVFPAVDRVLKSLDPTVVHYYQERHAGSVN